MSDIVITAATNIALPTQESVSEENWLVILECKSLPITDAFKEKWRAFFAILDHDQSGIWTVAECFADIQQLIDYYHPSEDLLPGFIDICMLAIDVLEAYAGKDAVRRGYTESEYVAAYVSYWSNHFDEFKERLLMFYSALFHAMDTNKDGVVSFDEFKLFYSEFGDNDSIKETARRAFKLIDADGDGVIGEDEFYDIYLKYLLDPDITANELPLF